MENNLQEDQPVKEQVEQPIVTHQHKAVDPITETKDNKTISVEFPHVTHSEMMKYVEAIGNLTREEINTLFTQDERYKIYETINKSSLHYPGTIYEKNVEQNIASLHNHVKYGDKELSIRDLPANVKPGVIKGKAAVARFTSIFSAGEVVQVPCYHSGFWVTIVPPKQTEIASIQNTIASAIITAGRETNTIAFSNYGVIVNRILLDFIMLHITDTTLIVPEGEDLRTYLSALDIPVLVLGILSSMYPNGANIIRSCKNTSVLNDDKKPKCDVSVTGKVNIKELLHVNTGVLNTSMLNTMSKRSPNTVTVDDIKEYKHFIADRMTLVKEYTTENGNKITITLKVPDALDYVKDGERWITNVIEKAKELFMDTDSEITKNNKVLTIMSTVIAGIYNTFVYEIKDDKGLIVNDRLTIDAVLEALSLDTELRKTFVTSCKEFVNDSTITIIGTPTWYCSKCNTEQITPDEHNNSLHKYIIPINVVEYFFVQSSLTSIKLSDITDTY